jgi:hypothetical protein
MEGKLTMLDKSCLNLGSGQSVTRNVDNIIDTTSDPIVSFVVSASTIASELESCQLTNIQRVVAKRSIRSILGRRQGMSPYISCAHPKQSWPCLAMAA